MKPSIENLKDKLNREAIGEWVTKYKKQVAAGCVVACIAVVGVASAANNSPSTDSTEEVTGAGIAGTASKAASVEQEAIKEANALEQDAYPEVNEVVQKYYTSMASNDMDTYTSVVDEVTEEEKNRILRNTTLVEGYENISCYTKKGLEEGSYLVYAYYEEKFAQIDTLAPGLALLYLYPNAEGNLVILKGEASDELRTYAEQVSQDDDVVALRAEVAAAYEEAKAADENLAALEERYLKIASDSAEEETEVAEATEEATEETGEETAAEETPAEETTSEENTGTTARNVTTRFTESVRLRAQASTDSENLGTGFQGESVTWIESYDNGWSKINYNGTECYCMTQYLEGADSDGGADTSTDTGSDSTGTAQNRSTRFTESVRLRAEASTDSVNLGTAFQGESVTEIERYDNGWSKINYNGTECYCMTQYLE